jgi:hypothetical protein
MRIRKFATTRKGIIFLKLIDRDYATALRIHIDYNAKGRQAVHDRRIGAVISCDIT